MITKKILQSFAVLKKSLVKVHSVSINCFMSTYVFYKCFKIYYINFKSKIYFTYSLLFLKDMSIKSYPNGASLQLVLSKQCNSFTCSGLAQKYKLSSKQP